MRRAEVHEQQLVVVNDRAYRERKYHEDGEVCNSSDYLFPILSIDDVQFRLYRRCDLHFLRMLETWRRYTDDHPTEQIFAAEIEGREVTVVMKRIRTETTDDTMNHEDISASMNKEVGPSADLAILKRVM